MGFQHEGGCPLWCIAKFYAFLCLQILALLVIAVAIGYSSSAPVVDLCKPCIEFAGQFINQLLNIILSKLSLLHGGNYLRVVVCFQMLELLVVALTFVKWWPIKRTVKQQAWCATYSVTLLASENLSASLKSRHCNRSVYAYVCTCKKKKNSR